MIVRVSLSVVINRCSLSSHCFLIIEFLDLLSSSVGKVRDTQGEELRRKSAIVLLSAVCVTEEVGDYGCGGGATMNDPSMPMVDVTLCSYICPRWSPPSCAMSAVSALSQVEEPTAVEDEAEEVVTVTATAKSTAAEEEEEKVSAKLHPPM